MIREEFFDLLETTKVDGVFELERHLENIEFFTAPCSAQYHLAVEGGLAEHSLNVCKCALSILDALYSKDDAAYLRNSVILISLLHDVGKCGQYGKPGYVENILKSGKRSDSKPFEVNKELLYIDHEIRSIQIINQFIELTEQETFAIVYHNGLYGNLKYAISGNETPLYLILHMADMWCSKVIEVENN